MNISSENRLKSVHPELAAKVRELAERLALEDIEIIVTQGLRTWQQQQNLYEQGRTKPGPIVTHAKPGRSYHNFGLAVDVAPIKDATIDWDVAHEPWKRIVAVAKTLGLTCGADFKSFPDWPHLQLTGGFPESPNDEVRALYAKGGIIAVWSASKLS